MSSASIHIVVLAAGQGTRMKSQSSEGPPLAFPGAPMLDCVIRTAESLTPETLTIVDRPRRGRGPLPFERSDEASSSPSSNRSSEPAHALLQAAPAARWTDGDPRAAVR